MSGSPLECVKLGAIKLGETLLSGGGERPFERFITMLYDTSIETHESANFDTYSNYIKNVRARGSTDFKKVFNWIQKFIKETAGLTEITVIFFTDGQDTCNSNKVVAKALEETQNDLARNEQLKSRFLTIGFSQDHDAVFMNKIAQAGVELGNFFFIDTRLDGY